MALLSETVNGTGSNVQIRVGCAECEKQDAGVQDTGQMLDASKPDGQDEGRGGCSGTCVVRKCEFFGIIGYEHSQEEDSQAVEEQDPVKSELDSAGNGLAWILCFSDGNTNQLSTQIGEHSVDQGCPEAVELAGIARVDVWLEGTRLLVVFESSGGGRTSTNSEQEGQDDYADDGDDLDGTEPKLEFTKELDAEIVNGANDNEEDRYPDTRIDFFFRFPFLQNQCGRCELVRRSNDVFAPIRPAKRKAESRVAETSSITSKSRRMGDPSGHLTESCHDNIDEETDGRIGDENRGRAVER